MGRIGFAVLMGGVVGVAHVTRTLLRFGAESQMVRWWHTGDPRCLYEALGVAAGAFLLSWLFGPRLRRIG
jgi:hypothetical protein